MTKLRGVENKIILKYQSFNDGKQYKQSNLITNRIQ